MSCCTRCLPQSAGADHFFQEQGRKLTYSTWLDSFKSFCYWCCYFVLFCFALLCPLTLYYFKEYVSHSVMSDSLRPMNCSPPGSSVHGISPSRILQWVATAYSGGSSHPGTEASSLVSPALAGVFFTPAPPGPSFLVYNNHFFHHNYILIKIPLFPCMSKQTNDQSHPFLLFLTEIT